MLKKYDEFAIKRKTIQDKKKNLKKQISELNKEKLKTKLDQYNKDKQDIQKKMNVYVNGASSY